jgi:hypothetical protein
MSSLIFVIIT